MGAHPRQTGAAASILIAGFVQRLETPRAAEALAALASAPAGPFWVQVELAMIHEACQALHAAGSPISYDSVLAKIRKLEPGGAFGFACIVFDELWQKRATWEVTDAEFEQAMAALASSAGSGAIAP